MKLSQLAFSTNAYTRYPLPTALHRIADQGYGAVEILADDPHVWLPDWDESRAELLAALLNELGLTISNINANTAAGYWEHAPKEPFFEPSLISPDEELRNYRLNLILDSLEFAAILGADCISITSGKPLGKMSPDRAMPVLEDMLRPVLAAADQAGVNVGIECEPGLLLENSTELVELIERIDHPRLGANLDLGHAIVGGEEPCQVIRRLAGRIWNIHLEDIRDRKHYHLIPGDGDVDFAAIVRALDEIGYTRFVTLELYTQSDNPDRAARLSRKRLSKLFEE